MICNDTYSQIVNDLDDLVAGEENEVLRLQTAALAQSLAGRVLKSWKSQVMNFILRLKWIQMAQRHNVIVVYPIYPYIILSYYKWDDSSSRLDWVSCIRVLFPLMSLLRNFCFIFIFFSHFCWLVQDLAPVWWTGPLFWPHRGDSSWRPWCCATLSPANTWVLSCRQLDSKIEKYQTKIWNFKSNSVLLRFSLANLGHPKFWRSRVSVCVCDIVFMSVEEIRLFAYASFLLQLLCEELCKDLNSMDFSDGSPKEPKWNRKGRSF